MWLSWSIVALLSIAFIIAEANDPKR